MAETKDTKQLVQLVEEETEKLPYVLRSNDLFTFSQSCDVINLCPDGNSSEDCKFPLLVGFRTFLLDCVLPWLKDITNIPLYDNKVDLTSSFYKQGDYLLCHDDVLEGRRVAFIWYIVPENWNGQIDGGELQLFESQPVGDDYNRENDGKFFPTTISTTIQPKRNMFLFFEVSPRSFHQVTEVLGYSKRISLHGWFHGPSLWTVSNKIVQSIEKISPIHIEEELIYQWINPVYFDSEQITKIRRRFHRTSEIQLTTFINAKKWKELVQCIQGLSAHYWLHCGPPNRRNYNCLSNTHVSDVPDICKQVIRLFKSEAMLVILSDITGIQLHPSALISENHNVTAVTDSKIADEETPKSKRMRADNLLDLTVTSDVNNQYSLPYLTEPCLRKLQPGSYTLLSDADMSNQGWRLECLLHIYGYSLKYHNKETQLQGVNSQSTCNSSCCGQTVYVANSEEDELLTVTPSDNSLTLVYADPDTSSFLKYINHATNRFTTHQNQSDIESNLDHLRSANEISSSNVDHTDGDPLQLFDLSVKYFDSGPDPQDLNCLQSDDINEISSCSSLNDVESNMPFTEDCDSDLENDDDGDENINK
uniref:2-oxoglutarate and iron-dependent oxygenase domain containing 1 n=1 Tax=Schistosoma japonicum TaxID=6182 RepID=C1LFF4_SCHJA|nr:2-oxoglutarate and iron-dependent oxygenase domain containing 1 [Schistosoma japonicum]